MTDVPVDTDEYIYRYVTCIQLEPATGVPVINSELRQIWISQP